MSRVELNVETDLLKRIIDEQPEIKIKLVSLAAEKIAEEISRKARTIGLGGVQEQIKQLIQTELNRLSGFFIQRQMEQMLNRDELQKACNEYVQRKLDEIMVSRADKIVAMMRDQVRKEFATILQEVKAL